MPSTFRRTQLAGTFLTVAGLSIFGAAALSSSREIIAHALEEDQARKLPFNLSAVGRVTGA